MKDFLKSDHEKITNFYLHSAVGTSHFNTTPTYDCDDWTEPRLEFEHLQKKVAMSDEAKELAISAWNDSIDYAYQSDDLAHAFAKLYEDHTRSCTSESFFDLISQLIEEDDETWKLLPLKTKQSKAVSALQVSSQGSWSSENPRGEALGETLGER